MPGQHGQLLFAKLRRVKAQEGRAAQALRANLRLHAKGAQHAGKLGLAQLLQGFLIAYVGMRKQLKTVVHEKPLHLDLV